MGFRAGRDYPPASMGWVKIPKENNEYFLRAIPTDPRIGTIKMFGGICMTVNGNMAAGTWGTGFMLRLSEADSKRAMKAGGDEFAPIGGRVMKNYVAMPESVFRKEKQLQKWLAKAVEHTGTLPPKKKKKKKATKKKTATKPATKKKATKKKTTKKKAATKPATKKKTTKKKAATKPATKKKAANKKAATKKKATAKKKSATKKKASKAATKRRPARKNAATKKKSKRKAR